MAGLLLAQGLLTLLAIPPVSVPGAPLVLLVPLALLLLDAARGDAPVRQGAIAGFLAGAVFALVEYAWVPFALARYTALFVPGTIAVVAIIAALWAAAAALAVAAWTRLVLPRWLALAAAFTAMDWARAHLPGLAFPWLGPGVDLAGTPLLIQAADTIGARGLTFLAVVVGTLVAEAAAALPRRWWRLAAAGSVTALLLAYGAWRFATLPLGATTPVGVVTAEVHAGEPPGVEDLLAFSTALQDSGVAFVVWPEAVDSTPVGPDAALLHALERSAEAGTPVLAGLMARDSAGGALFNTVRWFTAPGGEDVVYRKRRLVPGVESETTAPGGRAPLVPTRAGPAGILICFESGFEDLARDYRRRGAALLINPTNDAWGAGTTGPAQHRAHLVLRAVETRAAALRVTNLGVSETIDPLGRVTRIVAGPVGLPGPSPEIPPYVRLGDWVGVVSVVLSVGMLLACYRAGRSRTASRNMANRSASRRPERTSSPMISNARSTGTAGL